MKIKSMVKHYVEFLRPGILRSAISVCETTWNTLPLQLPKMYYGYRFFDKKVINHKTSAFETKPINHSKWHYIGQAFTLEQIKKQFPSERILIRNMIENSVNKIIKTKFGQAFPIENTDIVEVK